MRKHSDAQITAAVEECGSQSAAAAFLGINRRTLERRLSRIAVGKTHDSLRGDAPDGYYVKGCSTLYDATTGEARLEWVKTSRDEERQRELAQEALRALADDLPRIPQRKATPKGDDDLMTVVPIADLHLGMYSWGAETGEDYDLDIACRTLCSAVDYLVSRAPRSGRCLIANLGDIFHTDSLKGVTAESQHILDMDTRLPKVVYAGVQAVRQCIETALSHHERVEFVSAPGNHDPMLSMVLAIGLQHIYEREPRVKIHAQPTLRHYLTHGRCLVGIVHGDKTKDRDLPGIMATERPRDWGETEHRFWYRGHHHHSERMEYNGCVVEQFRTLAARDAYAAGLGHKPGRDLQAIVLHAEDGEVSRLSCSVNMANNHQSA